MDLWNRFQEKILLDNSTQTLLVLMDVTKTIIPHFRQNKEGAIVNISSIGGQMTFALGTLYHGTKFAVEGISESLHYEMKELGVKVKIRARIYCYRLWWPFF